MKRYGVNKAKSARKFRGQVAKTKVINIKAVSRGGIKL